jgi:lysophospholipase L1-like esterase
MSTQIETKSKPVHTSRKAKLGLILFSLVLTCLLLEAGMRLSAALDRRKARTEMKAGQTPQGEYWAIYDPDLGYRQNPQWGDLNADGLRDRPIREKTDRNRLLFLGDSVAFYGDSLDDTLVAYMRAELGRQHHFEKLEIINAGIKGYTNYQELQYLKKFGLNFKPDIVGVEFCLNDLHKFLHSFQVENGQIVYGTYNFSSEALGNVQTKPRTLAQRIADKSYLLRWLKSNIGIVSKIISWKAHNGYSFDYRVDISNAWQDGAWKNIEAQLAEAAALGHSRSFKMFVVVVPVAPQYESSYVARDRDYVLKPQRKLKEICERLNIPFYDLYPDLNAELFEDDGIHLTKEGRQIAGRRLAAFFADSHLTTEALSAKATP